MCTFLLVQSSWSLHFCTYTFQTGEPQGTLNRDSPHRAILCQSRLWDQLGRCSPSVPHLHRRLGRRGSVSPVRACKDQFQPSRPIQSGIWHRCWPLQYIHDHYTFVLPWEVVFLISLFWFSSCERGSCSQGGRMEPTCQTMSQRHAWRRKKSGSPVLCCHTATSYHCVISYKLQEWSPTTLVWKV